MAVKKTGEKKAKKAPAKTSYKKRATSKASEKELTPVKSNDDKEIQEILDRIFSDIDKPRESSGRTEEENREQKFTFAKPSFSKIKISKNFEPQEIAPTRNPTKLTFPLILLIVIVISGFWGRQIVSVLGIPVNPGPFTALYFNDPHVSGSGITKGSKVAFGIHNGYPIAKTIRWQASIADHVFMSGKVKLKPYSSRDIELPVSSGQPGDFLNISDDMLKTPISAVITQ